MTGGQIVCPPACKGCITPIKKEESDEAQDLQAGPFGCRAAGASRLRPVSRLPLAAHTGAHPPHFNGAGQIDAWGEKSTVLILPILGGVVLGMLQFVAFLCAGMKTPASARPMLAMETMCRILGALTALVFAYLTVCSALAVPLGGWFMPAFAAAAALPIVACVIWACIPKRK